MTREELVAKISIAVSEMEGFNKKGSRAQRNNNPGNLRRWGKTPVVDGFANFPTLAEGWAALRRQVAKNVGRGLTLYEFFGGKPGFYPGYAPDADGNHSRNYAEYVAKRVQILADVPLNKIEAAMTSVDACPTCGRAYGGD
jgi:hypothetical protein